MEDEGGVGGVEVGEADGAEFERDELAAEFGEEAEGVAGFGIAVDGDGDEEAAGVLPAGFAVVTVEAWDVFAQVVEEIFRQLPGDGGECFGARVAGEVFSLLDVFWG